MVCLVQQDVASQPPMRLILGVSSYTKVNSVIHDSAWVSTNPLSQPTLSLSTEENGIRGLERRRAPAAECDMSGPGAFCNRLFGFGVWGKRRLPTGFSDCFRVNLAHLRQSRPDSDLDLSHFQVKVFSRLEVAPSSLDFGRRKNGARRMWYRGTSLIRTPPP